jgi:hypothetical protein
MELVRDIYFQLFFTGLTSMYSIKQNHISLGIDGDKWIAKPTMDTLQKIPLLPMAMEIVDKYKNHPTCVNENRFLPILSNQK